MRTLVIVAMQKEADAIVDLLPSSWVLRVCGVGKVNAAAETALGIEIDRPDRVLNFGVCGGLDHSMSVGMVYEVGKAVEWDFDLSEVNMTEVGTHEERDQPYFTFRTHGIFPIRWMATGDRFSDSIEDRALIQTKLGCSLRDMEGAAIAHVCEKRGIDITSIKAISDVAGRGSMTGQYADNIEMALRSLRDSARKWIDLTESDMV